MTASPAVKYRLTVDLHNELCHTAALKGLAFVYSARWQQVALNPQVKAIKEEVSDSRKQNTYNRDSAPTRQQQQSIDLLDARQAVLQDYDMESAKIQSAADQNKKHFRDKI
jgi:hypothetical protein